MSVMDLLTEAWRTIAVYGRIKRLGQRIDIGGLDVQSNNRSTPHNIKVVVVSMSKPLLGRKKSIGMLVNNQVELK